MEKFYRCVEQTGVTGSHERSITRSEKEIQKWCQRLLLKAQDLDVLEHSEILRVIPREF